MNIDFKPSKNIIKKNKTPKLVNYNPHVTGFAENQYHQVLYR